MDTKRGPRTRFPTQRRLPSARATPPAESHTDAPDSGATTHQLG